MAEGFLKSFDKNLEVYSAGTRPEKKVNPRSIIVMNEVGIDISANKPDPVEKYLNSTFDYVITVCDGAKENCPVFSGDVKHHLHIGFEDPADAIGTDDEVLSVYRKIRDQIKNEFSEFYKRIQ